MNRRTKTFRRYWKPLVGFAAAGIWLVAPFAAVTSVLVVISSAHVVADTDVWVSPTSADGAKERAVGLDMTWSTPESIFAPGWQGIVQRVRIKAGDEVSTGTNVARVGDVERLAAATAVPFNSPLQRGDSGPAVSALNTLLAELEIADHGNGREFNLATLRGVRELAARVGVSDSRTVSAFDPSWVVFIPSSPVVVDAIELEVGAPAPAPGEVIASTKPLLESVTLVEAAELPTAQSNEEIEANVTLSPVVADDGETLRVAATDMLLEEDNSSLTVDARVSLAPLVQGGVRFTRGTLVQPSAGNEFEVPASSVITDTTGITCVVTSAAKPADPAGPADSADPARKTSTSMTSQPVVVDVTGSQAGTAWVIGDLDHKDSILVAPRGDERRCKE